MKSVTLITLLSLLALSIASHLKAQSRIRLGNANIWSHTNSCKYSSKSGDTTIYDCTNGKTEVCRLRLKDHDSGFWEDQDDNIFILARSSFTVFNELPYDLDGDVEFVHESGSCD